MITPDQYNSLMGALEEIKFLLKTSSGDRVGGIDLAMEVTGYSRVSIYKKIKRKDNPLPHRKDGTLKFSERELRKWMVDQDDMVPERVKKKAGRKALITQNHP